MNLLVRFFIKAICFVWRILPRWLVRFLGVLVGVLWFDILRIRRQIIDENLSIAFPDWSAQKKKQIGRASVYEMGANFSEFFTLPSLDQQWLEKTVVFSGYENLEKAKSMGKGVYLLGMHMGSGDLTASAIAMKGNDLFLISKFFKNKFINDLWFGIRRSQGVKFIEPHGEKTAFDILRAIRQKALVGFVLDQFMGRPFGLETTFFGRKTGTAYGLALFVLKTGSPVVPVYSYEGSDAKIHIVFEPSLELQSLIDGDKDQTVLRLTQYFNDCIEKIIRKHPKDWMWVHRRWKEYE